MRTMDKQGRELCEVQAEIFALSTTKLEMSSEVFARRYMNSLIAKEFDLPAFLIDTGAGFDDFFIYLDEQYGPSTYGSVKYHRDIMYWCGYLYRHIAYCYQMPSKQVYKLFPLKYVASTYPSFHTLSVQVAVERLFETKNFVPEPADSVEAGVAILKRIRAKAAI